MLLILGWIACFVASFLLLVDECREDYDVRVGDAIFFIFLSIFGPCSLLAAIILWLVPRLKKIGPVPGMKYAVFKKKSR